MILTDSLRSDWQKEHSDSYSNYIVTRYFPRHLRMTKEEIHKSKNIDWLPQLAPSIDLLNKWKKALITEAEFERIYKDGLIDSQKARLTIDLIYNSSVKGDKKTVLLCWENEEPHEFCHRHILKEFIIKFGEYIAFDDKVDYSLGKLMKQGLVEYVK